MARFLYIKLKTRQNWSIVLGDNTVVTFGVGGAWNWAGGVLQSNGHVPFCDPGAGFLGVLT